MSKDDLEVEVKANAAARRDLNMLQWHHDRKAMRAAAARAKQALVLPPPQAPDPTWTEAFERLFS